MLLDFCWGSEMEERKENLDPNRVYLVQQHVFWGCFCIHKDLPEDDALDQCWDLIKKGNTTLEIPTDDKERFRDRLFGGFECGDSGDRRHVIYAQLHYTFLGGLQRALTTGDRANIFDELFAAGNKFIGGGAFLSSCPVQEIKT